MSVIRVNKTKDYTIMSNQHFKEKEMSLKAKGLLSLMLSLPDNWDYSINGLVAICKENASSIKSALKELKDFGYLEVIKKKPNETETGRIEYIYDIYEKPKQDTKKQGIENLYVENLCIENQLQLNTNKSNTNKLNTNNNIYSLVIDYLNKKANTNYKSTTKKTQTLIDARSKEGFKIEDFYKVIDNMTKKWINTEWEIYLRPETLFGTKFESYLNVKVKNKMPDYSNDEGSLNINEIIGD